jgi:threonine/homoserine/homoserine lactone efflux protein
VVTDADRVGTRAVMVSLAQLAVFVPAAALVAISPGANLLAMRNVLGLRASGFGLRASPAAPDTNASAPSDGLRLARQELVTVVSNPKALWRC